MKRKKKKLQPAKDCLCARPPKPLYPINGHSAACPVSRRYTVNARMIADLMHSENMRGNAKDYVILSGSTLTDCDGTFEMQIEKNDGDTVRLTSPEVCIVHKRNLYKFIGAEQAAKFWRPGFGRLKNGN